MGRNKLDLNQIFSYRTDLEVAIPTRLFGLLYRLAQITMIGYFIYQVPLKSDKKRGKKKMNFLITKGETIFQLSGSGEIPIEGAKSMIWDIADISRPEVGKNSIFIPTKAIVSLDQKRDTCQDYSEPCTENLDCRATGGLCKDSLCVSKNWCGASLLSYKYETADKVFIWFKSFVSFAFLNEKSEFSTFKEEVPRYPPDPQANTYTLRRLLKEFGEENVWYHNIAERGAIIKVNIMWNCQVNSENCMPQIQLKRIDNIDTDVQLGYNKCKYDYQLLNGELRRNFYNMTGIKFIINSVGIGSKISISGIVYEIASLIMLLQLPTVLFDLIILYLHPESKNYYKYKYEFCQIGEDARRNSERPSLEEPKKEQFIIENKAEPVRNNERASENSSLMEESDDDDDSVR